MAGCRRWSLVRRALPDCGAPWFPVSPRLRVTVGAPNAQRRIDSVDARPAPECPAEGMEMRARLPVRGRGYEQTWLRARWWPMPLLRDRPPGRLQPPEGKVVVLCGKLPRETGPPANLDTATNNPRKAPARRTYNPTSYGPHGRARSAVSPSLTLNSRSRSGNAHHTFVRRP